MTYRGPQPRPKPPPSPAFNFLNFNIDSNPLELHHLQEQRNLETQKKIAVMAGPKLKLYVDTVSPFAYMAYYITRVRSIFLHPLASTPAQL
jgi:hypothetical protein